MKALMSLPKLIISMIKALLRVRKDRKEFVHTPKTFTGMNEPSN